MIKIATLYRNKNVGLGGRVDLGGASLTIPHGARILLLGEREPSKDGKERWSVCVAYDDPERKPQPQSGGSDFGSARGADGSQPGVGPGGAEPLPGDDDTPF